MKYRSNISKWILNCIQGELMPQSEKTMKSIMISANRWHGITSHGARDSKSCFLIQNILSLEVWSHEVMRAEILCMNYSGLQTTKCWTLISGLRIIPGESSRNY